MMTSGNNWQIKYAKSIVKELRKIPKKDQQRIKEKIELLAKSDDPNTLGKNLKGAQYGDIYRLRIGNYRCLCKVENKLLIIIIIRICHRKEVYK